MALRISAVPTAELGRIRASGQDDDGNPFVPRVDLEGGAPLRCCLRDSRAGERTALIAYRPFSQPGPYAEIGPIFVHADPCAGYAEVDRYPEEFRGRQQVFRSYRADGSIAGGVLVPAAAEGQERVAAELLANPDVAFVHSRNVLHGCFMFEIRHPGRA